MRDRFPWLTMGERGWRAVALLLLIALLWQAGNASLAAPPRVAGPADDLVMPATATAILRPVESAQQEPPKPVVRATPAPAPPAPPPTAAIATSPPAAAGPAAAAPPAAAPTVAAPPAAAPTVAAPPAAAPTVAAPVVPPTAQPVNPGEARVRVANTNGLGVYLRSEPKLTARIRPWIDGTEMIALGPLAQGDGRTWRQVRDPLGTIGWIPVDFLVDG